MQTERMRKWIQPRRPRPGETCSTSSFSFLFLSELSFMIQTRFENRRVFVILAGVECDVQFLEELLNELIVNWHGRLTSDMVFSFFLATEISLERRRSMFIKLETEKNRRLEKESSNHLLPPWPSYSSRAGPPRPLSRTLRVCRLTAVVYKCTLRLSSRHFFTAVH